MKPVYSIIKKPDPFLQSLVLCVVDVDVNNRLAFELSADPTSPNGPVPKVGVWGNKMAVFPLEKYLIFRMLQLINNAS